MSYLSITRDLTIVRYLADRIGAMYLAQLVEIGRTEDAFRGPHHPDAEAFSPPSPIRMSRLPGHGFGSPAPSQAQQRQP